MARLESAFYPDGIEDQQFEPIPEGSYIAHITDSALIPTKSGTGQMLKLTFEIMDGPCARRLVFENLNILNANTQAQEIAQRSLKRLCVAIGHHGALTDSEDLHFKPMRIRVAIRPAEGAYGPQNVVRAYDALGGHVAASQPAVAAEAKRETTYAKESGARKRPRG
jgi:hypothetical protein